MVKGNSYFWQIVSFVYTLMLNCSFSFFSPVITIIISSSFQFLTFVFIFSARRRDR